MASSKSRFTLYLDACCLNRPFDDPTQARIRLEAEAVLLLIFQAHLLGWDWLGSEVLSYEIDRIPSPERRVRVKSLMMSINRRVHLDSETVLRATKLQRLGFRAYDALHVACAESGNADILLTTDDRFCRLARRYAGEIRVAVENPLRWIQEMLR